MDSLKFKVVAMIPHREDGFEQAKKAALSLCDTIVSKDKDIEVITHCDQGLGLHHLFNSCIDFAMQFHPELICIFGSDTIMLTEGWDRKFATAMGKSDGACHAVLVDEQDKILYAGSREGQDAEMFGHHIGTLLPAGTPQPWLTHSAVCISAQALMDVADYRMAHPELGAGKYYSEDYTLFCGDRELTYIMRILGYGLFIHNGVKVIHAHGGSQTVKKVYPDFMAIARKDNELLHSRWGEMMDSWR
jgi:hypothetical protein